MGAPFKRVERFLSRFSAKDATSFLRIALAITYIWFGALKILGISPVAELVGKMAFFIPKGFFVRIVGVWEVLIGIALLFRLALRLTLSLYFLQLAGTFLVFVFHPRDTFQDKNPLKLTLTGEFIIKNLVLFAAGLVIGTTHLDKPKCNGL